MCRFSGAFIVSDGAEGALTVRGKKEMAPSRPTMALKKGSTSAWTGMSANLHCRFRMASLKTETLVRELAMHVKHGDGHVLDLGELLCSPHLISMLITTVQLDSDLQEL